MAESKPECEVEINHLVDLTEDSGDAKERRKKAVAFAALTEWKESLQVVERKLSRRTKRVDCLTNEIYQLVGLYGVFVGVVFTAVVSDRVQCQHIWSPIVLCLLPCFIIVQIISRNFSFVNHIRDEIADDEKSRRKLLSNLANLKAKGYKGFNFSVDAKEEVVKPEEKAHERIVTRPVVIILLLASAVIVLSFVHILCFTKRPGGCEDWNPLDTGLVS